MHVLTYIQRRPGFVNPNQAVPEKKTENFTETGPALQRAVDKFLSDGSVVIGGRRYFREQYSLKERGGFCLANPDRRIVAECLEQAGYAPELVLKYS